jgi:hypothetical protein
VANGAGLVAALGALLPDRGRRARMAAQGLAVADATALAGQETLAKLRPLLDRFLGPADASA